MEFNPLVLQVTTYLNSLTGEELFALVPGVINEVTADPGTVDNDFGIVSYGSSNQNPANYPVDTVLLKIGFKVIGTGEAYLRFIDKEVLFTTYQGELINPGLLSHLAFSVEPTKITSIKIMGPNRVVIPSSDEEPEVITYTAKVEDQYGNEMQNETVTWRLFEEEVIGVSLAENIITITPETEVGTTFTIIATSDTDNNVTSELVVKITDIDECFIATAAFGSKLDPAVTLLRHFRDTRLLTNSPGQIFVNFYYTHSPSIAEVIAKNEWLKFIVKIFLLAVIPLAWALMNLEISLLFLIMGVLYMVVRQKRRREIDARMF
jgi:hypothetical protein